MGAAGKGVAGCGVGVGVHIDAVQGGVRAITLRRVDHAETVRHPDMALHQLFVHHGRQFDLSPSGAQPNPVAVDHAHALGISGREV